MPQAGGPGLDLEPPAKSRQPAAAILLFLGGAFGIAALVLPWSGLSGWETYQMLGDRAATDLPMYEAAAGVALCIIAVAGAGVAQIGVAIAALIPMAGHRIPGVIGLLVTLVAVALAVWFVLALEFKLGNIGAGGYSLLGSGVIGLVGALIATIRKPGSVPAPSRPPAAQPPAMYQQPPRQQPYQSYQPSPPQQPGQPPAGGPQPYQPPQAPYGTPQQGPPQRPPQPGPPQQGPPQPGPPQQGPPQQGPPH